MAAYNGVVSVISADFDTIKYADNFTHISRSYTGKRSEIYPEIEYSIPPEPLPDADYAGILYEEIYNWIENKKFATYSAAPPPPTPTIDVSSDIIFTNNIESSKNADLFKNGVHTNAKYTGQIYPRLYDWTGVKYGTFG
jgi:hypothetical protein